MRSARKLKKTTESPSAIGPMGVPSASDEDDRSDELVGDAGGVRGCALRPPLTVAVAGAEPRTIASHASFVRSHRLSRSIA